MLLLLITTISHIELTYEALCPTKKSVYHYFHLFYCSNSPFLLGIVYTGISRAVLDPALPIVDLLITIYVSFRRHYTDDLLTTDIASAIFSSLALVFFRGLYTICSPASIRRMWNRNNKSKAYLPENSEISRMNKMSKSSIQKTGCSSNIIKLTANHLRSKAQEIANLESIRNFEKFELEDNLEDSPDNDNAEFINLIDVGFDYEYCFVFEKGKQKIKSANRRTFEKRLIDLYQTLQTSIDRGDQIELVGKDEDVGQSVDESDRELRDTLSNWRFMPDNIDSNCKKLRYWSMHTSLADILDELNQEYSKKHGNPFDKLIKLTTFSIKKSKTDFDNQPVDAETQAKSLKKHTTLNTTNLNEVIIPKTPSIIRRYTDFNDLFTIEFCFLVKFKVKKYSPSIFKNSKISGMDNDSNPKDIDSDEVHQFEARIIPFKHYNEDQSECKTEFHLYLRRTKDEAAKSSSTQMMYFISHEMRSPLIAVLGLIKLFVRETTIRSQTPNNYQKLVAKYLNTAELHINNLLEACLVILDIAKNGVTKNIKGVEFDLCKVIIDCMRVFEFEQRRNPARKLMVSFFGSDPLDLKELLERDFYTEPEILELDEEDLNSANLVKAEDPYTKVTSSIFKSKNSPRNFSKHESIRTGNSMHHKTSILKEISEKYIPSRQHKSLKENSTLRKYVYYIRSDPIRIKQILLNLISNAMKYTPKGTVTVSVEQTDQEENPLSRKIGKRSKQIRISVIDSGIGISETDQQKLFKEFGRVSNSIDESLNSGGIGLGLLLSNNMCKQLSSMNKQAGIQVKSQVGKGSIFSFYVENKFINDIERDILTMQPADRGKKHGEIIKKINQFSQERIPDWENLYNLNNMRKMMSEFGMNNSVCLVDDSEINLEILGNMLESLSLTVDMFASPCDALQSIQEKFKLDCPECRVFNLLIVDYEMPIMNGLELARKVRALGGAYLTIPIICATAQELDQRSENNKVFTGQLVKPISMENVLDLMRMYIEPRASHECKYQIAEVSNDQKGPYFTGKAATELSMHFSKKQSADTYQVGRQLDERSSSVRLPKYEFKQNKNILHELHHIAKRIVTTDET